MNSNEAALRTAAGDLINYDEARRLGYILGSGGKRFSVGLPAVFLFELVSRYAESLMERKARLQRAAMDAFPHAGGAASEYSASDGSTGHKEVGPNSSSDEGGDVGVNGCTDGGSDGGGDDGDNNELHGGRVPPDDGGHDVDAPEASSMEDGIAALRPNAQGLTGVLHSALRVHVDGKLLGSGTPQAYETVICHCESTLSISRAASGWPQYAAITPHNLFSGKLPDVSRSDAGVCRPLFRDGGPAYVGYGRTLRKVRIIADTPPFVPYVERRKLAGCCPRSGLTRSRCCTVGCGTCLQTRLPLTRSSSTSEHMAVHQPSRASS